MDSSMQSALEGVPRPGAAFLERHHWAWFAIILGFGAAFRLLLWSGYGLGDDPNYFMAYHGILLSGTFDRWEPYSMRFGISVPGVLFMKLFGVTEAGFIGAITVYSIVNLAIIYGLARQEWDRPRAPPRVVFRAAFA